MLLFIVKTRKGTWSLAGNTRFEPSLVAVGRALKIACSFFTPPKVGERGIVFGWFLSFFLYLFLCQQHREKTPGPICMNFSGKVWSDHGTTWLNFGSIRVNGSGVKGQFVCYHRPYLRELAYHSLGGSRVRGLLCLAPQLVMNNISGFIKNIELYVA